MPELRRYRLMPLDFNTGHHLLDLVDEGADPEVRAQTERNRKAQIHRLRYIHGEANLEAVIANIQALGADPFSTVGWHLQLWRELHHAFVSGAYFPAAVGAGAVAERVLNHLLIDLADDCATEVDRRKIEAPKAPTYAAALEILNGWDVLEPASAEEFERLRIIRNNLVHFNDGLYEDPRGRSLEAVLVLRDALDGQWGVFVHRRLIPGTPGMMYARKAVEDEPFFRRYLAPVMAYVSPHHGLHHDPDTGLWVATTEEPSMPTPTPTRSSCATSGTSAERPGSRNRASNSLCRLPDPRLRHLIHRQRAQQAHQVDQLASSRVLAQVPL